MNWYKGSIAEAVKLSKQKNSIFVVFVDGKDESSSKLRGFINDTRIRSKLETENFVAVCIEGGSESYMQFASIYQLVPVPSLFFIGKSGTPLEIATGAISSVDQLEKKIENVLQAAGKIAISGGTTTTSSSASFILGEQASTSKASSASSSESAAASTLPEKKKPICEYVESPEKSKAVSVAVNISKDDSTAKTAVATLSKEESDIPKESANERNKAEDVINEMQTAGSEAFADDASTSKTPIVTTLSEVEEIICENGICYKKPTEQKANISGEQNFTEVCSANTSKDTTNEKSVVATTAQTKDGVCGNKPMKPTLVTNIAEGKNAEKPVKQVVLDPRNNTELTAADLAARVEETRKMLEKKRRERIEEERRLEKEKEITRRKEGKDVQNVHQWQKDQELKDLKENVRRERLEEQAARQRILEKIAIDRAERAQKFATDSTKITGSLPPSTDNIEGQSASTASSSTGMATSYSDTARLQFRIANGISKTHTFKSTEHFDTVRSFVRTELLPGTGIKEFTLAASYPKREFVAVDDNMTLQQHGLCPSAVILVIAKQSNGPSAIVARSGGVVNIFNTIFWTLISPVLAVLGYLRNVISGRGNIDPGARDGGSGRTATPGAQKRANEEKIDLNDSALKRKFDRFGNSPSTSKAADSEKQPSETYRRLVGGSNIHRLSDNQKDSDDENATWNGNSTQQQ